eukprot:767307-Hanusia_phi.AAC.1
MQQRLSIEINDGDAAHSVNPLPWSIGLLIVLSQMSVASEYLPGRLLCAATVEHPPHPSPSLPSSPILPHQSGADIHSVDTRFNDWTSLNFAADKGHDQVVRMLTRTRTRTGVKRSSRSKRSRSWRIELNVAGAGGGAALLWITSAREDGTSREARVKWRLKCIRDKEWISAAPRPYGPSRSWGGAWGGSRSIFSNSKDVNQPGVFDFVGGEVRMKDVFLLSIIHNIKRPELPMIEHSGSLACSRSVLTESSTTSFGHHLITPHKRTMLRPVSHQSSKSTYAVIRDVQVGLPPTGYPGWRNRNSISHMKLTPVSSMSD